MRAEGVDLDDELRPRFHLSTPWGAGEVRLALHGIQQVPNALAAAAAALWCGVPFDGVVAALATATGSPLRMEVRRVPDGPVLVVDCYNANPARPRRRCDRSRPCRPGRKVALLGLMAELGSETEAEHRRAARLADELGIEVVGYQTALYGPAAGGHRRRGRRPAAHPGSGRCRPREGKPRGPARGRRRSATTKERRRRSRQSPAPARTLVDAPSGSAAPTRTRRDSSP